MAAGPRESDRMIKSGVPELMGEPPPYEQVMGARRQRMTTGSGEIVRQMFDRVVAPPSYPGQSAGQLGAASTVTGVTPSQNLSDHLLFSSAHTTQSRALQQRTRRYFLIHKPLTESDVSTSERFQIGPTSESSNSPHFITGQLAQQPNTGSGNTQSVSDSVSAKTKPTSSSSSENASTIQPVSALCSGGTVLEKKIHVESRISSPLVLQSGRLISIGPPATSRHSTDCSTLDQREGQGRIQGQSHVRGASDGNIKVSTNTTAAQSKPQLFANDQMSDSPSTSSSQLYHSTDSGDYR